MSNEQIQEIEKNIKEAKKIVEIGDALERLKSNRDFRSVILEGYFEEEAIRLVHLKADVSMQTPDRQKVILAQIDAIGALSEYFGVVRHKTSIARKAIASDEETVTELLAEEINNV